MPPDIAFAIGARSAGEYQEHFGINRPRAVLTEASDSEAADYARVYNLSSLPGWPPPVVAEGPLVCCPG